MSWTVEAQKRAVEHVFTGARTFALVLNDGTEYPERVEGVMLPPSLIGGAWRAANEHIEFPPFARTMEDVRVTAVAIYDGTVRLASLPVPPVLVQERVQPVLRPGDLLVGLAQ
jgi:hypothetical protein